MSWIDSKNNLMLGRKSGDDTLSVRVDSFILAVGSNSKYVVAKNKNLHSDETYYFFIDKSKDNNYLNQSEITQGPFTEDQFSKLKEKLGLPDFTREF